MRRSSKSAEVLQTRYSASRRRSCWQVDCKNEIQQEGVENFECKRSSDRTCQCAEKKFPLALQERWSDKTCCCGGKELPAVAPSLRRQTVNNSAVFLIHERKDGSSRPEASNTFSGKKRSNSDSAFMGFITDKIKPVCADAAECSRSLKMLRKEVISDQSGKNQDELQFPIYSPLRSTSLHSPLGSRPVLHSSKLERPIPPNSGSIVQYPSHVAKTGLFSSSYVYKDANVSAILMSQPAADEGSRTGIKSSGVLNVVTSSSGPGERSIARVLPYCSRPKCMQIHEPESSNASRYNGLPNVGRQMTVFYAGQAHVFDDVHPNKAEVIMALAGSTGGSWSTTYSQKPATCPSSGEVPTELIQRHINSFPSIQVNPEHALCQVDKTTLTRDIPSLTSGGGQESGSVVKDARLGIQAPLPSPAGQREAS